MKVTEVTVYRAVSAERAENIRLALEGRTYFKFYVNVCPFNGMFHVNVGTLRKKTSKKALTEAILDLLCGDVAFGQVRQQFTNPEKKEST